MENEKKTGAKRLIVFLLIFAIIIIWLVFTHQFPPSSKDNNSNYNSNYTPSSKSSYSVSSSSNRSSNVSSNNDSSVDKVIDMIDSVCSSNLGPGYLGYTKRTENGLNYIVLKFSADGAAEEYAANSADWISLTSAANDLTKSCRKMFTDRGLTDWHVVLSILNDQNLDRVLFSSVDGVKAH